jgi:2,4-dienoyl-CoA reductase-like NADH-dependent reductase (Old Yellow Enzyme family)
MKAMEPIRIKDVEFQNRVVMAPMVPFGIEPGENGAMSEEGMRHYELRMPNRMGLMICQSLSVTGDLPTSGGACAHSAAHRTYLNHLAEGCHRNGTKFFAQLAYPGAGYPDGPDVNAYTSDDLKRIGREFVSAAEICRDAGCDGVELHGAHGFFLNKMASPLSNRRGDGYGGGLAGRLRLAEDITSGIRAFTDGRFILSYRMGWNGDLETDAETARALERMGIELLHVSAGIPWDRAIPRPQDFSYNDVAYTGTFVKRHVGIPVTVVNGLNTLRRGNALVEAGLCDFIAYGKPFLADEAFLTLSLADPDHRPCLECKTCKWFSDGSKCPAQVRSRKARPSV